MEKEHVPFPNGYPSAMYHVEHPTGKVFIFTDRAESDEKCKAMEKDGWVDTPAKLPQKAADNPPIDPGVPAFDPDNANKEELEAFARTKGVELDRRKKLSKLRDEVWALINGDPD